MSHRVHMRTSAKAILYGLAALVLSCVVIVSGVATGVLPTTSPIFDPKSSNTLSILLTDPPSVPSGITALYVTYTGLAIHIEGFGDSGWVGVGGPGAVETLGLVNLTQTIASADVPAGTYNMIRLSIARVTVTFRGANYSANYESRRLDVLLVGGLRLNATGDAAAVIDMQPTVINLGTQSSPEFMMTTGAKALQVPSGEVHPDMRRTGFMSQLPTMQWYMRFSARHSGDLTVDSVSLTPGSLTLRLTNPTSDKVFVRMVAVTPAAAGYSGGYALGMMGSSVVFAVASDGTILPIRAHMGGSMMGGVSSLLEGGGFTLDSGSSVTLSFTGSMSSMVGGQVISTGSSYTITVVGEHLLASSLVQAG